jgi:hypothetical protein
MDRQAARNVGAQGPRFDGTVKAVDPQKNTVKVNHRTYTAAKDALVVVDGRQRPLADLPVGTASMYICSICASINKRLA